MEWKEIFNYGLPTVLLAALCWVLWKIALWLKSNVVEPVVKSHIGLIECLKMAIATQTTDIKEIRIGISSIDKTVKESTEKLNEIKEANHQSLREVKEALTSQTEVLAQAINYQTTVVEDKKTEPKKSPESQSHMFQQEQKP